MQDVFMWAGGIFLPLLFGLAGWAWKQHNRDIRDILAQIGAGREKLENRVDKVYEKCEDLERRHESHRLHAAETFATKIDVKDLTDRVIGQLEKMESKSDKFHQKMEEKINTKADKQ